MFAPHYQTSYVTGAVQAGITITRKPRKKRNKGTKAIYVTNSHLLQTYQPETLLPLVVKYRLATLAKR